jgi:hypothetical protein
VGGVHIHILGGGGGGGCIFIYSCSALLISFESHCFYGMCQLSRLYSYPE